MRETRAEGEARPEIVWRPILAGAEAAEARRVAIEIADELRTSPGAAAEAPGLARGLAGLSILFSYLARTGLCPDAADVADDLIARARALLIARPSSTSLFHGVTGLAFAYSYAVEGSEAWHQSETIAATTEAVLDRVLSETQWQGHSDLLQGLIGLLVYCGSRSDDERLAPLISKLLALLHGCAEAVEDGVVWRTYPFDLAPRARELHPNGYFDLGLAHGGPGVMIALSEWANRGFLSSTSIDLATRTKRWLDCQVDRSGNLPRLANFVSEDSSDRGLRRIAWCHGDTSLAASYILSGRLLSRPAWMEEGIALAADIDRCPESADGIVDGCFCHGTAGVAHLLNRLAQLTTNGRLRELSIMWTRRVLRMRSEGAAVGGYPMRWGTVDSHSTQPEPGLLFGAAGVALTLLAAASSEPPDWDQLFLLSSPKLT